MRCLAPILAVLLLAGAAVLAQETAEEPAEAPAEAAEQAAAPTDEAVPEEAGPPKEGAVLQGLDKITARISTFDAPIGEPVMFGSLEITARTCHKTPPEEPPESAAFLEIVDAKPDSPRRELFTGWMFASSPAVSALEHPVYDVWVVDCTKASTSSSEASSGN